MKEAIPPAVALVACGSAGIALCSGLTKERYGIATIIAMDTSEKALKACRNADRTMRIHPRWTKDRCHLLDFGRLPRHIKPPSSMVG